VWRCYKNCGSNFSVDILSFFLEIYLWVDLLVYIIKLYLNYQWIVTLYSKVTASFTFPQAEHECLNFFPCLSAFIITCVCYLHSCVYDRSTYCALICISLITSDVVHLFMCLLAICICHAVKCVFKTFSYFLIELIGFSDWIIRDLCIFFIWILCQIYDLHISSPSFLIVFPFSWYQFWCINIILWSQVYMCVCVCVCVCVCLFWLLVFQCYK
jgi:hypothetical protein